MGAQVIDRAGLILDIFAQRARTKEGRLQVELAQYKYLLPRLTGMWGHLVRQTASGENPHWNPRPRRNPAGNRPPAHPPEDRQAHRGPGGGPPDSGGPAGPPGEE
ncbi:MAG: hypothetical protein ACLR1T_03725 [Evtepia gabavorous]